VFTKKRTDAVPRTTTGRHSIALLMLLACAASLSCAASVSAHKAEKNKQTRSAHNLRAMIWHDPGRVPSLNLLYGAGGKGHAPDPKGRFTFVKEDLQATSPKFDVKDQQGVEWKVKLGEEPRSETAAARFLWAAGYFVDEDYYLPAFRVTGMPTLRRGQEFVSADGTIRGARLERKLKDVEKHGTWDWFENPFTDRRELNGLRIMMAFLNNWDLKDVNNSIYETGGQRRYVVTDLGASFGNTGNPMTRSKSAPQEYADSKFVDKATSTYVDFVLHSRPFFLTALDVPNYQMRTRIEGITRKIPRADAKWLGRRLSMLSSAQIGDGFRAGGYTPEEVMVYTQAVKKRIAELNAL
jgi:hypothetical protein